MAKVIDITQEHPDYRARKAMRRKYRHLYTGGEQLKESASEYLVRRQKEPADVYEERLNRVYYENYVGSIIDWYAATLFRREPALSFDSPDEFARRFFRTFAEDCDRKGTALSDYFRRQLVETLVEGVSYTLVDFPRSDRPAGNKAEEEARGISRAYLVPYTAEDLINWSHDQTGNLEWVVLRTSRLRKARIDDEAWTEDTTWTYYDKERFAVYQQRPDGPVLVDRGHHALAGQHRVPLFDLRVTDGLWLMNKAGLLQLEHFNKSNALSWALTMGLFAMPVVYSEREWSQMVGESYYIQLGPEDRFGWTEPEGHVYQIAASNLDRLKEEIYRVCYLMTQAGGPLSSGTSQSGLSKQRDYAITQEVLRAYGDAVKDTLKRILRTIGEARGDVISIDVSGLDEFDIGDFSSEIDDAERLLAMNIGSTSFKKQIFRRLASKYLCDVRQEVKDEISTEIDAWLNQSA